MKVETVEEFLKRGGKIKRVSFRESKTLTYKETNRQIARSCAKKHPWQVKT